MKLSQYGFEFKPELIAHYPEENRDEARMMVVHRKDGTIEHRIFKDILDYFEENDMFVFNDTKVFPARLYGNKEKTGAEIEIFLLRELNRELRLWDVLVDPARKIRIGNKLYFGEDDILGAEVIDNTTSRGRTLRFLFDGSYEEFKETLFKLGETPLPRWVRQNVEPEDAERYQTIFAAKEGAVVAPTAGMHFSKHLLNYSICSNCICKELCASIQYGHLRSIYLYQHIIYMHSVESSHKVFQSRYLYLPLLKRGASGGGGNIIRHCIYIGIGTKIHPMKEHSCVWFGRFYSHCNR